jgi:multidrug efflux pump subunit AcrB
VADHHETFRDMGIAYAAGMLLISLVVAQFRNIVPLIIMAPIPSRSLA